MNVPLPLAWATVATSTILWIGGSVYVSLQQIDQHHRVKKNRAAVSLLCARAKILEDILRGGVAIVTAERLDPNVPPETHAADDSFIRLFKSDLEELRRQQNAPGSPCVKLEDS